MIVALVVVSGNRCSFVGKVGMIKEGQNFPLVLHLGHAELKTIDLQEN